MTIDNVPSELAVSGKRGNSRPAYSWILGGFLGIVLTVVLAGALVWLSTGLGLLHLIRVLRGQPTGNVNQPTIVRQIQQLQRLETVSYTADKIISGGHANAYL